MNDIKSATMRSEIQASGQGRKERKSQHSRKSSTGARSSKSVAVTAGERKRQGAIQVHPTLKLAKEMSSQMSKSLEKVTK